MESKFMKEGRKEFVKGDQKIGVHEKGKEL